MRTVGIKTLKNKLSEYVRSAASGETILVTDRDRVVAELRPPDETRGRTLPDAVLADLVRQGVITPALAAPAPPPETEGVAPLTEILRELEEDRADR